MEAAAGNARPHQPRTLLRIVNVSDFDFELPEELIAQHPPAERGRSRLIVFDRATGQTQHTTFDQLPAHLTRGDLLVVNDTRVFPARLLGHRVPSGGAVECLLIRRLEVGAVGWEFRGASWQRRRVGSVDAPGTEAQARCTGALRARRGNARRRSARASLLRPALDSARGAGW